MSGTKNKLSDLNDHLFAQIERLGEEDITPEKLEQEVERGHAVVAVADQIVRIASLRLQAAKLVSDHGFDPTPHLPEVISGGKQIEAKALPRPERRQ